MHERWPLALLLVSVVTTASKTFIPTSRDVLLTVSFNSMGGNGLSHAFVFNRLDEAERDTGLLIDNTGRIANVGNEDWIALQQLVSDAKSTVADSGRKSDTWSRSEYGSCPSGAFYSLGPADDKGSIYVPLLPHRPRNQRRSARAHPARWLNCG
ncbi:hypothetical protein DFH09DRAFT_1128770 [Mycena vulgaris]|nr:hypothetical protein DFH09DRAFT_1128770 [Mycena vulgaris]